MNIERRDQIPEIQGHFLMEQANVDVFSECLAQGFRGYNYFEYVSGKQYKKDGVKLVWEVAIRAIGGGAVGVGDSEDPKAVAVFAPPLYGGSRIIPYLRLGGYKLFRHFPISKILSLLFYENYVMSQKKKHTGHKCWYLYGFAVQPEHTGKGLGSRVVKPMLAYFDRTGQDCYLETLDEENLPMYRHLGFEVVGQGRIPGTDIPLFSMVRKPQKTNLA